MSAIYSLYEGSYSVDKTKVFKPFDPKIHDPKDRPGSLFIHVHPFLIDTPNGLVLCDAGLGHRQENGELIITENIRKLGFSPLEVRYVLMSHLHQDHVGGLADTKTGEITFPNAKYVIQEGEWQEARKTADPEIQEIFDILEKSNKMLFVEGDGEVDGFIEFKHNGAHTANHQVFFIDTELGKCFFGGDVLPEPEELFVSFVAKYDLDGKLARDLRKQYWEKGREEGWIYLFYHSKNITIGKAEQKSDGTFKLVDAV
ncbi:MAG TPA: MBL fold metallo-hydrolase [Candidatus Sphingobacterium stercoripullorum]|nr:MBL fold metallo-hydrolase [Candidatus Sphingobacterium stercoripullorum]